MTLRHIDNQCIVKSLLQKGMCMLWSVDVVKEGFVQSVVEASGAALLLDKAGAQQTYK